MSFFKCNKLYIVIWLSCKLQFTKWSKALLPLFTFHCLVFLSFWPLKKVKKIISPRLQLFNASCILPYWRGKHGEFDEHHTQNRYDWYLELFNLLHNLCLLDPYKLWNRVWLSVLKKTRRFKIGPNEPWTWPESDRTVPDYRTGSYWVKGWV